ncbi:Superoxide dismutase [Mn] [Durusdinium trenchii]|uniref:Superoxide dismutase [Fe] n=1 Tax=Durusdinium trenchii TaxID=1381693 RepID=A0ABP0M926_9DINO
MVEDGDEMAKESAHFDVNQDEIIVLPTPEEVLSSKPFPKGARVLARFPKTSTFYDATVVKRVEHHKKLPEYCVRFDDDERDATGEIRVVKVVADEAAQSSSPLATRSPDPTQSRSLRNMLANLAQKTVQRAGAARSFHAAAAASTAYKLPDLAYDFGALEPAISGQIMEIHYTKHHQTYVTNLNATLEKYAEAEAKQDVASMIALQGALKFNGGGHVNHTLFWENLAPPSQGGGGEPTGDLAAAIDAKWGSFDAFKKEMNATTAAVQGSGWGWLAYDPAAKGLRIVTCANQDPCSTTGCKPLLGIDVWEHAYYLDYKNVRPDYLNAIWDVVNFDTVAKRLAAAQQ